MVLCFPCNQFGGQEPGLAPEVEEWAKGKFMKPTSPSSSRKCSGGPPGETKEGFYFFDKVDVNGRAANAMFEFLKKSLPGIFWTTSVKWNFTKFLVDRDGIPFKRYSPHTAPMSLEADVQKLLARKPSRLRKAVHGVMQKLGKKRSKRRDLDLGTAALDVLETHKIDLARKAGEEAAAKA